MDTVADRLWARLRLAAEEWVRQGKPVPMDGEAEAFVIAVIRSERADVPSTVLDFYTREFLSMIESERPRE